ncbi:MAG: signal peptidase I [Nitrospinae bacterium]|jgi:signal peptidase I|nr:signal peptidase I [Nitrospinota bacterium]
MEKVENIERASVTEQTKKKSIVREYAEAIIIALLLAFIIRTFVVQAFKIPSGSMIPTLQIGDHILVNKFIYRFTDIKKGDIIVFKFPRDESRDFIKRVIGLPGDKIEIKNKRVYINDTLLNESYAYHEEEGGSSYHPRDNFGPIIIPENKFFVMGDNRENSMDSRFWGFLDKYKVRGKAFIVYWSWDSLNFGVRWNRLGMILK